MNKYRMIEYETFPCWYELSYLPEEIALLLRVHEDFVQTLKSVPDDSPFVKGFMKDFGFKKFVGTLDKNLGFDDVLERRAVKDGFMEFMIKIPTVNVETGEKCESCKEKGKRGKEFGYDECLYCRGTGEKTEHDWNGSFAISASLNLFFRISQFPTQDSSAPFPQLITIKTSTHHDMHGGSLGGVYGIPFCEWLDGFEEHTTFPNVREAMMSVHRKMFGEKGSSLDLYYFRAKMFYRGRISLDIPGNACGIYIDGMDRIEQGQGRKFSCHNVDTPMQQITLLCGLASLHDQARKEIKKGKGI